MELVSIILPKTLPFHSPTTAEQLGLQGRSRSLAPRCWPSSAALIEAVLNESCFPYKVIHPRELDFTYPSAMTLSAPLCMSWALYENLALAAHGSQP